MAGTERSVRVKPRPAFAEARCWQRAFASLTPTLALFSTAPASANPLFAGADPDMIFAEGQYWIYSTDPGPSPENRCSGSLYAYSSPNLQSQWQRRVELIRREDISWIKPDEPAPACLWAPSVLHKDGTYFLYFSVGPQETDRKSRIGVATAPKPWGPFKDSGKMLPVLRDKFEAIDPMVFLDPRLGAAYLYAGGSDGSTLKVFRLRPDMVSIDEEMRNVPQPVAFTEAPFMHVRRGVYYLSYSHGRWNEPEYSVHYSTSSFPTGPWTYQGPILSEDGKRRGPGHHAFVTDPATGTDLILYHRWDSPGDPPFNGSRSVALDRVHYCSDGRILPVVMTDNGSRAALPSRREPEERAAGAAATAREAGGD